MVIVEVVDLLNSATAWMSTTEVMHELGGTRSSVGRALRRLWERDTVEKTKVPDAPRLTMQWRLSKFKHLPFADSAFAKTATTTPPKLHVVRTVHMAHPVTMLSTNFTNQGDLQMQIEQGVEAIVTDWVTAEKTFSAHDVTEELRVRVNAGTIKLDPGLAGTVHVNNQDVTKVEHPLVAGAVRQLMAGNRFPDYIKEHNPAGFYEYKAVAKSAGLPTTQTAPSAPVVADGSTYDGDSTL